MFFCADFESLTQEIEEPEGENNIYIRPKIIKSINHAASCYT